MKDEPQKIIIVGATSGIGRELARIYASKGFRVGVTGRRTNLLLSLQQEFPENILIESFDVTGKENIPHFQNLIENLMALIFLFTTAATEKFQESLTGKLKGRQPKSM